MDQCLKKMGANVPSGVCSNVKRDLSDDSSGAKEGWGMAVTETPAKRERLGNDAVDDEGSAATQVTDFVKGKKQEYSKFHYQLLKRGQQL